MFEPTPRGVVLLVTAVVASTPLVRAGEPRQSEREAMYYRYLEFPSYVKGGSIEPHWMADGMNLANTQELLRDLERQPERVQLHKAALEEAIAWCMDEIHRLAQDGETQRKIQLVAIEYRARLLLERWTKRNLN